MSRDLINVKDFRHQAFIARDVRTSRFRFLRG